MTEANKASATDIDLAAADWVQRRHLWSWTEADQSEFEAWLAYRTQTTSLTSGRKLFGIRQAG